MLLPPTCPVCGRTGAVLCADCAGQLEPAPLGSGVPALFAYAGAGRALVTALKFRNRRSALRIVGRALAAKAPAPVDVVTWAPTTPGHRRARGFDQAELLARAVAAAARGPCRGLLRRRAGPPQTGQSRADRLAGPRFEACRPVPARVLVVDDVVTTGATLRAAAAALRQAGAVEITLLALAATPSHRPETPR
jgi:predicted amidophosphoribosyltransferase